MIWNSWLTPPELSHQSSAKKPPDLPEAAQGDTGPLDHDRLDLPQGEE